MTLRRSDIESYADRIATGAAEDGTPWTLPGAYGEWLARRYGVTLTLGAGDYRLRDVAQQIATRILEGNK